MGQDVADSAQPSSAGNTEAVPFPPGTPSYEQTGQMGSAATVFSSMCAFLKVCVCRYVCPGLTLSADGRGIAMHTCSAADKGQAWDFTPAAGPRHTEHKERAPRRAGGSTQWPRSSMLPTSPLSLWEILEFTR